MDKIQMEKEVFEKIISRLDKHDKRIKRIEVIMYVGAGLIAGQSPELIAKAIPLIMGA